MAVDIDTAHPDITPPGTPQPQPQPPAAPDTSLLGALSQLHDQAVQEELEPITVPIHKHWHDLLAIRYDYPSDGVDSILRAQTRMQQKGGATLEAALDVVVGTAAEIVGRRSVDSEWERPLGDDKPLVWGPELAQMLGVDLEGVSKKSRTLCRYLFSPKAVRTGVFDGDLAIVEHAGEVTAWMRDGAENAEDAFAGE